MVVSINPRPSQLQFVRAMRMRFPMSRIKHIRKSKNEAEFFVHPEDTASRECLMLPSTIQEAFLNATVNAINTLSKPNSSPSFVIVKFRHKVIGSEQKHKILNNNAMDVINVTRIIKRNSGQPTKLIRLITSSNNQVSRAQKRGFKIGWQQHQSANSFFILHKSVAKQLVVSVALKSLALKTAQSKKNAPSAQTVVVLKPLSIAAALPVRSRQLRLRKMDTIYSTITNKFRPQRNHEMTPSTEKLLSY